MNITHKITMDFSNPGSVPRIHVVQGDCLTRQVAVTLLSAGQVWTIPSGTSAGIRYRKPDGTGGSYDTLPDGTTAWSVSKNVITFTLAPQMLTAAGCVEAQAVLTAGNDILATFSFQLIVAKDPSLGALQSEDYINWFQWSQERLIEQLDALQESGAYSPSLSGGTMTGTINMNGNRITNLSDPKADGDALSLGYGSGIFASLISRDTFTGDIDKVDNADNLHVNSVVWVTPSTQNLPSSNYGFCITLGSNARAYIQSIYYNTGSICRRMFYNSAWTPWKWVNPAAVASTEYLTTERYNGKDVYMKQINCGTITPGGSIRVSHEASATAIIQFAGFLSDGTAIPNWKGATAYTHATVSVDDITITCGSSGTAQKAYIRIWYTKD